MKNLKTMLAGLAMAGALISAMTSNSYANVIGVSGDLQLTRTSGAGTEGPLFQYPGGEFTAYNVTGALPSFMNSYAVGKTMDVTSIAGMDFQTFCVEGTETYATAVNYEVNDKAMWGGTGGSGNPVSVGTAWLYANFATGNLLNYRWDASTISSFNSRAAAAYDLQKAIWALEGYAIGDTSAFYYQYAVLHFGSASTAMADDVGSTYGVYALNLTLRDGTRRQDMLVYVPDGGVSLILLGMGLAGLSAYRRFKNG